MGSGEIGLDDAQVFANHIQAGVPEGGLQGEDVTAVAQELNGECVAEAVGVAIPEFGALAEAVDEFKESQAVEIGAIIRNEEIGVGEGVIAL